MEIKTIKTGNKYTLRINGTAILMGATKKVYTETISDIKNGVYDDYIKRFCK